MSVKVNKNGIWMTEEAERTLDNIFGMSERIAFGMPNEEDKKVIEKMRREERETEERRKSLAAHSLGKGKCPVDGRMDRPIYIITNNRRTLAVADGMGHAYRADNGYVSKCLPETRYDPAEYEFERGLSGMDF